MVFVFRITTARFRQSAPKQKSPESKAWRGILDCGVLRCI